VLDFIQYIWKIFFDSLSIYLQYCFVFLSCIYVHALDLLQALLSSYKERGQFVGLLVAWGGMTVERRNHFTQLKATSYCIGVINLKFYWSRSMPDIGVKPQIEIFLVEVSSQAPSSDIPTPKEAKIRSLDVAAIWPFC
jgi:hypothetical protein